MFYCYLVGVRDCIEGYVKHCTSTYDPNQTDCVLPFMSCTAGPKTNYITCVSQLSLLGIKLTASKASPPYIPQGFLDSGKTYLGYLRSTIFLFA
jgi:hypothetical protein